MKLEKFNVSIVTFDENRSFVCLFFFRILQFFVKKQLHTYTHSRLRRHDDSGDERCFLFTLFNDDENETTQQKPKG